MDLQDLVKSNRRHILRLILRSGGASRTDIAREVGLAMSTVTDLTDMLIRKGILSEQPGHTTGKPGRPTVVLGLNSAQTLTVVGHYYQGAAFAHVVQPDGAIVNTESAAVAGDPDKPSFPAYVTAQQTAIENAARASWERLQSIVLVGPGIIDSQRGSILLSAGYGWKDQPLLEHFTGFGKPLFLQNTSRLRAMAENWYGAARDVDDFLYFHLDAGIGGAVVLEGDLVVGPSHGAGEFGHMQLAPHGPVCSCGSQGCLEALASMPSIAGAASKAGCSTFQEAWELFERRDDRAVGTFNTASWFLARAIRNASIAIGPTTVILGGRMVDQTGGEIVTLIRNRLDEFNPFAQELDIRCCALPDNRSQILGAVAYGLQEVQLDV